MLQQATPDDYVIATGEQYSVREFATRAAKLLGFDLRWHGEGVNEHGIDEGTGKTIVRIDQRYFRPTEVDTLLGDASKARRALGWTPQIGFDELVREMLESDRTLAAREALIAREGYPVRKHFE